MKFLDKLIKGMLKYKIKLVIEKTFGGDLSRNKPESSFIYQINKTINVESSVLFATVTELQHTVLGIFIVQFIGDDADIAQVKEYLISQGVEWQEVTI